MKTDKKSELDIPASLCQGIAPSIWKKKHISIFNNQFTRKKKNIPNNHEAHVIHVTPQDTTTTIPV